MSFYFLETVDNNVIQLFSDLHFILI